MRKVRAHGTYAKYVCERCRCDECRAANREYERRRRREWLERQYGARPPRLVDAADAREHLLALSAAGIGPKQVEALCGVGKTAQWKIRSGRVTHILRETEHAICEVGTDAHVLLGSRVDASEAKAIVAELLAAGWTTTALAAALGSRAKTPKLQVVRTDHCTLRTLKALRLLREATRRGHLRSA